MLQLVAAQGVACEGHVNAQSGGHEEGDLARISIVPMHSKQLAGGLVLRQPDQSCLGVCDAAGRKLSQVRPQLLLPDAITSNA